MIAFKSNFYIQPMRTMYAIGILWIFQIFFFGYFPSEVKNYLEIGLSFLYPCLFACVTFYLFFTTYDKSKIEKYIEYLENEREEKRKINLRFVNEAQLLEYEKIRLEVSRSHSYVHCFRSKKEITGAWSLVYYILIVAMLFFSQNCFEHIQPLGPIIYFALIFISILVCILVPYWELFHLKNFKWSVSIWILAIYILLALAKSFYIKNYGDEVLGSYFERPEYRTKYFVNLVAEDGDRTQLKLPAIIYVHSESEEVESGEDRFGQIHSKFYDSKFIELEIVYLANGDSLKFDDCLLEIEGELQCMDETGTAWYIQLTSEKVQ